jgi:DNA-binding SARP family transcriptional activator
MVLTNSSDEEALQCWLEMLYRHGKRQEALKCYQDMKDFVEAQGFTFSSR